jgi:hypothetical protein
MNIAENFSSWGILNITLKKVNFSTVRAHLIIAKLLHKNKIIQEMNRYVLTEVTYM